MKTFDPTLVVGHTNLDFIVNSAGMVLVYRNNCCIMGILFIIK